MSKSILNDTSFANCDLRGTNLSCTGLENCIWNGAVYDASTLWSENFIALQYGAVNVDESKKKGHKYFYNNLIE